jgi:hypothetical protein
VNTGKTVFAQIMQLVPRYEFNKCVRRYEGNQGVRSFPCWSQFLCMTYAQLTGRSSLRDIETCLNAHPERLYHMGFRGLIARSTLADANERRDFSIYADFASHLIHQARALYQGEELVVDLDNTIYALDSTTIDLCLALFPWARFRKTKGAVKMHTLLDLRGSIPAFITLSTGKLHDVNVLDVLPLEAQSIVTMDRAYVDFARLYRIHRLPAYFVVRAKRNVLFRRVSSNPPDPERGVRADQTVVLQTKDSRAAYPEPLRRVSFYDANRDKRLVFLTNHFDVPAPMVAELYRQRWQVELFFKWVKQHLRIKAFFGTSPNAVKTQIWTAISLYLLIAIAKKKLDLPGSLHTILHLLEVNAFEKKSIKQLVIDALRQDDGTQNSKQLNLFDN